MHLKVNHVHENWCDSAADRVNGRSLASRRHRTSNLAQTSRRTNHATLITHVFFLTPPCSACSSGGGMTRLFLSSSEPSFSRLELLSDADGVRSGGESRTESRYCRGQLRRRGEGGGGQTGSGTYRTVETDKVTQHRDKHNGTRAKALDIDGRGGLTTQSMHNVDNVSQR